MAVWGEKKNDWRVPIVSWSEEVEPEAMEQAIALAKHPAVFKRVALMPDVHVGYGMPIGGVIACENAVIPNAVGADIGCGMRAVQTSILLETIHPHQIETIITKIQKRIPVGFAHHSKDQEWEGFSLAPVIEIVQKELPGAKKQLGTLGGGNHFIELQAGDNGTLWAMLHSGSRNFGYKIAKYYNEAAKRLCARWYSTLPSPDLAFLPLDDQVGIGYLASMNYAMAFAKQNRAAMMKIVTEEIAEELGDFLKIQEIDVHHNYAALEHHYGKNVMVHRKGAIRAREGDVGIIPGSMGTPSYIVAGLGSPDSFQSCSHGAGRKMGRAEFSRTHTLGECDAEMEGIAFAGWGKDRNGNPDLSEAPSAYKDIDKVIKQEKDLVEVITKLRPLGVVKG